MEIIIPRILALVFKTVLDSKNKSPCFKLTPSGRRSIRNLAIIVFPLPVFPIKPKVSSFLISKERLFNKTALPWFLFATTWTSLLYNGYEKYKNYSEKISNKTIEFASKLRDIPNYIVIGEPEINDVAFYNEEYSIGQLSEYLTKNDWNINILQNPICLHICITPKNIDSIDELLELLKNINNFPKIEKNENITAIYGMAAKIPDKSIVNELIEYYLDLTTQI